MGVQIRIRNIWLPLHKLHVYRIEKNVFLEFVVMFSEFMRTYYETDEKKK